MTAKKSTDVATNQRNLGDMTEIMLLKEAQDPINEVVVNKLVAAKLQKRSNQSTITAEPESKDSDDFSSKKLYINAEGKYVLPERTPEEIAQQAQAIRDMFAEWDREYDTEEQRETFAYLQRALSDDFPSEGLLSENPLSVSQ